jgi:hypothetical protein
MDREFLGPEYAVQYSRPFEAGKLGPVRVLCKTGFIEFQRNACAFRTLCSPPGKTCHGVVAGFRFYCRRS